MVRLRVKVKVKVKVKIKILCSGVWWHAAACSTIQRHAVACGKTPTGGFSKSTAAACGGCRYCEGGNLQKI